MYKYLKGKLVEVENKALTIEVGGIGYAVFVGLGNANKLIKKIDQEIVLWVWMKLTDDEIQLYGFSSQEQVEFFKKLIGVSGVGPKSALSLMDLGEVDKLLQAIELTDVGYLSKAVGIGKKSAQRIIVELKGKLTEIDFINEDKDLEQALKGLGYSRSEYQDILSVLPSELNTLEEKISWILKKMAR